MVALTSPYASDWVFEHAQRAPDAACAGTPSGWCSYGALAERVRALASSLTREGLRAGEIVVNGLGNQIAGIAWTLAAQSAGACVAELERKLSENTLGAIRAETGARFAAVLPQDVNAYRRASFERLWVMQTEGALAQSDDGGGTGLFLDGHDEIDARAHSAPRPQRSAEDPALLVYTSGSTGAPRAVVQTHRNLSANTRAIAEFLELTARDRACLVLPLSYCYGKSVLLTHLYAGGSIYMDPRFMYPRVVLEAMAGERCTGFAGVPLTFELLKRQVDVRAIAMPSLRYVTQAGGAMHPDTSEWARSAFAPAELFVMYGQTEATARLTYLPPSDALGKRGSVGRAVRGVELAIVDERGTPLPAAAIGHVVVRGESVTPGYFRAPDATAEILHDGWLWTGDLGYLDEQGYLFLTGRVKDILKIGGHRVSAKEIEEALGNHASILEVAVIGVPDPVSGEAALACVVPRAPATLSADDVRRHAREHLAAYKVPREVVFLRALPRTANGKVSRSELLRAANGGGHD